MIENLTSSEFELKVRKPKILFFDIETAPLITKSWRMWDNPSRLVRDWFILSFSAKIGGKVITKCLADYKGYKPGTDDDKALVTDLAKLFEQADIIIGHNGDKFDIRRVMARLIIHQLPPLPPAKTVDTLKVAKRLGGFSQNSLKGLARAMGLDKKLETGGTMDLWDACESGDPKAWAAMKRYNRQDVVVLEQLYYRFLPYMPNHPNLGLMSNLEDACPNCAGTEFIKKGFAYTRTGKAPRFRCTNCKSYSTGRHTKLTEIR